MTASVTTAVALASCSAYGGPVCTKTVGLYSPCGFESETTTCAGATKTCSPSGVGFLCTFAPVESSCTITVVVKDGTTHDVNVTVTSTSATCPNPSPNYQSFASPTCKSASAPEAGADASLD